MRNKKPMHFDRKPASVRIRAPERILLCDIFWNRELEKGRKDEDIMHETFSKNIIIYMQKCIEKEEKENALLQNAFYKQIIKSYKVLKKRKSKKIIDFEKKREKTREKISYFGLQIYGWKTNICFSR